jgi:hypothetical protein
VLGAGHQAHVLDKVVISARDYLLHAILVYTRLLC